MTTPQQSREAAAGRKARKAVKAQETSELALLGGVPGPQPGRPASNTRPMRHFPLKRSNRLNRKPGALNAKRPKRKKSPSLSKLKKVLWAEISQLVRSWSATCVVPDCGEVTQCCAHIVPANDGAATRFFLPNLYPCCFSHNEAERRQRGSWVYRHREMFGDDFVDALYAMSKTTFQIKKWWVLEQTERMRALRLRGTALRIAAVPSDPLPGGALVRAEPLGEVFGLKAGRAFGARSHDDSIEA